MNQFANPRFLVLRGGAIGDFVLTLPVFAALRRTWPDAYIEVAGYPHIAALAGAARLVDHVVSLDAAGMARFFVPGAQFEDDQVEWIHSFEIILSYLHDPIGLVRTNLVAAGARQVVCGSPLVREGHACDHLVRPLEQLAIYEKDPIPRLELAAPHLEQGRAWLGEKRVERVMAIHAGSGSPSKNWPLESFLELGDRIFRAHGLQPMYIVGEADRDIEEALRRERPDLALIGGQDLVGLAGILSACAAYVGNDSGITHLAAAVGLPVTCLFGPSRSVSWSPRGPRVTVLEAPGGRLENISVDRVWAALAR